MSLPKGQKTIYQLVAAKPEQKRRQLKWKFEVFCLQWEVTTVQVWKNNWTWRKIACTRYRNFICKSSALWYIYSLHGEAKQ